MPAEGCFVSGVLMFIALFAAWLIIAVVRALFGALAPIFFGIMWTILSVMLGIIAVVLLIYCVVIGLVLVWRGME